MNIKQVRYRVSSNSFTTPITSLYEEKSLCIYEDDSFWQSIQIDILGTTKEGGF